MSTLQYNIRAFRLKAGYTQEEVADMVGIARPKYTEYETRNCRIPDGIVDKLCVLYHTDKSILLHADRQTLKDATICAYRIEAISDADRLKTERFNSIVGTYIGMLQKGR